jgi:hypothetical protein
MSSEIDRVLRVRVVASGQPDPAPTRGQSLRGIMDCPLIFAFPVEEEETPAPTFASIARSRGPTLGGLTRTVTGTNFIVGATTVTIGGVAATSVNVTSPTSLTCVIPAGTTGAKDVVVTTVGGSSTGGTGAFTYYDITSMSFTVFQEDFAGSPWNGTATAGSSFSRAWTEASNAPDVGSQIGTTGLEPATFVSANSDRLTLGNGETLDTLINNNAYTICVLIKPTSADAPVGADSMWNDPCLMMDASGWAGTSYTTSGFQAFAYPSAGNTVEVAVTAPTGVWSFGQARLTTGGTLDARVNAGTPATDGPIGGNIGAMSATVRIGSRLGSSGPYYNGDIAALYVADFAFTDSERDDLLDYVRARFQLPLT